VAGIFAIRADVPSAGVFGVVIDHPRVQQFALMSRVGAVMFFDASPR